MKSIVTQLRAQFQAALVRAFGEDVADVDPLIRPSTDPKFGDYQSNVAMGLAKKLGRKPREIAQELIDALVAGDDAIVETPEIAGPGFINLRLRSDWLATALNAAPPVVDDVEDRLGIEPVAADAREVVVVDLSSPNVAKQMHVGHLRSTIIGDTIARVLAFEGHEVIRQNHIGDWGTQFGIILEEAFDRGLLPRELSDETDRGHDLPHDPEELEQLYKDGNARMSDPEFAERARRNVTRLQGGDRSADLAWRFITGESLQGIIELYKRLNVSLDASHTRGESFYNPLLAAVVGEIKAALGGGEGDQNRDSDQSRDRKGAVSSQFQRGAHTASEANDACEQEPLPDGRGSDQTGSAPANAGGLHAECRIDAGALCVFLSKPDGSPGFKGPEGNPLPMIIQKTDGAYLYASTDMAAILFRINDFEQQPVNLRTPELAAALGNVAPQDADLSRRGGLGATRILYVVGAPQKLHFQMLFPTARAMGWTRPGDGSREVRLEHVSFGSVLGDDRKMLKTRSGENVKLKDLLDEAVRRAEAGVREAEADPDKRRGFDEPEVRHIAETIGISAVKYADLCQNRNTDYIFSWDKMLALAGNTAPYMLYAYARIRSIHRKGDDETSKSQNAKKSKPESSQTAGREQSPRIHLDHPAERALALRILQLPDTLDAVSQTLLPSILCEYLYDLAGRFMSFYEQCPVLKAPDAATRSSRLGLCDLTARTLRLGLGLMGIPTLERM